MTSRPPRVAVIRFPGLNCESETRRAVMAQDVAADVFMWNGPTAELARYDGYVLPGGFSYQDRVRAGAIAAKDRVMDCIIEQAALGKPVLGICNGAQILVESGLVPGLGDGRVEMALARNIMPDREGYYSRWAYLRVESPGTAATATLSHGDLVPVPIAHAEGRFVTTDPALIDRLFASGQVVFTYATPDGLTSDEFPWNPNGSTASIAGISNPAGNVVAMMPHPERCAWLYQTPESLAGTWGVRRRAARGDVSMLHLPGPGAEILRSLCRRLPVVEEV
jgi:phosphoribosylformylglycinamidine synthase I